MSETKPTLLIDPTPVQSLVPVETAEVDLASMTLEQLSDRVHAERGLVGQHLHQAVLHCIELGQALLEVNGRLPLGEWYQWVSDHDLTRYQAGTCMRLAYRRDYLTDGGRDLTVKSALAQIAGLPSRSYDRRSDEAKALDNEIHRLLDDGLTYQEVSELLGVSTSSIWSRRNPEARERHKRKAREKLRRERAARKALAEKEAREERDRLAADRGGHLGKAYDQVRKLMPTLDAAITEGLSVEARALAVRLEDEIFKALK